MKSDVAAVQLKQTDKVSYAEYALISILLLVATKFCTLPSVIAGIAGSKAVWSILILAVIEIGILFFATATAKSGGFPALPLAKGIKISLLLFFLLFFTLKLTALSREIATYFALSLFENVPVLPILILLLLACALVAQKGYAAVGRLMEILARLFLFVLLFVLIFTRTEGDLFNALAIFSPDPSGIAEGVFKGAAWFGDGAVVAFLDLSGEDRLSPHAKGLSGDPTRVKAKRKLTLVAALSACLIVVLFYAVFTSVYGDAAKMTDYAFIKLSAFKANTDELGSADWPVIILWSLFSCLYLALLLLSGRGCLGALFVQTKEGKKRGTLLSFLPLALAAVLLSACLLEEEGEYAAFMTRVMNVVTIVAGALTVAVGAYALSRRKGEKNETAQ